MDHTSLADLTPRVSDAARAGPVVVQFGLPYSPNLGDGVISDCLRHAVTQLAPGATFRSVDLSTRTGFGAQVVRNRKLALRVLSVLPTPLRRALVTRKLAAVLDAAEAEWRGSVAGADVVLIGGGQLFSDADLNFPLKIARAADLAAEAGVPVSIYAAGVARNWSARGAALYARLLDTRLATVGLRDAASCGAWRDQMGKRGPAPVLMRDPGLLARACYGDVTADDRVGLCVSDPGILRYHADSARPSTGFLEIAHALLARGHRLRLFCNGAEEDGIAQAKLAAALSVEIASGAVESAPVPQRPEALAHLVGSCRAFVAHRLHACIVGYSYRRPGVGLGWDDKVESFFASVGLGAAFAPAGTAPDMIADRLEMAIANGIDQAAAMRAEQEVLEGLRTALAPALSPVQGGVAAPGRQPEARGITARTG